MTLTETAAAGPATAPGEDVEAPRRPAPPRWGRHWRPALALTALTALLVGAYQAASAAADLSVGSPLHDALGPAVTAVALLTLVALVCAQPLAASRVAVSLAAGSALLVVAYHVAQTAPDLVTVRYALFWTGLLTGVVPLLAVLLGSGSGAPPSREATRAVLVALGLFTALPKLLRAPDAPVLYDEQLHVSQAQAIAQAGGLFGVANPVVSAVEHYPGLHAVLVAGHWLTGAPTYQVGLVVVAVAHVAALFAVAALARVMGADERVAGLAGGLFALTPGFTFFATMVAYQSLALPVAMWTLVAGLTLARSRGRSPRARAWLLALTLAGVGAVAVTHHLTTFMLVTALVVLAGAQLVSEERPRAAVGAAALLVLLAITAVLIQLALAGDQLASVGKYLFPGVDAIAPSFSTSDGDTGTVRAGGGQADRGAFSGSLLPLYEQLAGYAAPLVVTALAAAGARLGRLRLTAAWARRAGLLALAAYPATFPLIFSARGATIAHRSWPFLMVLLMPLVAAGVLELQGRLLRGCRPLAATWRLVRLARARLARARLARARRTPARLSRAALARARPDRAHGRARRLRLLQRVRLVRVQLSPTATTAVVLSLLAVLFVGNTATEANDNVRFPGHQQVGADGRAADEHTHAAAAWLRRTHGPGARITADTSTAMSLVASARAWKVRAYPTWELVMDPSGVGVRQLARTEARELEYLVLDTRVGTQVPARGYYFEEYEPKAFSGVPLTGPDALEELDEVDWARRVFTSGPVRIYRLHPRAAGVRQADVRRARALTPQHLLELDASAP